MPVANSFFSELNRGLVHLFYPRLCEGCGKALSGGEKVLCLGCAEELPETGYHNIPDNETALRFAGRVPFMHATSLAYFTDDGLLQHLLHGLKYKGKKEIGYYLGARLGLSLKNTDWAGAIDTIVPVPLHRRKEAKRGYNQSMLIAEGIGDMLNIPVSGKLLLRVRDTESQTRKTRTERVNNMADAFTIPKHISLSGKHILLIDDVLTTGATLEACALALLKQEGVRVSIGTIGIAV
jgi:ComF family protein